MNNHRKQKSNRSDLSIIISLLSLTEMNEKEIDFCLVGNYEDKKLECYVYLLRSRNYEPTIQICQQN